MESFDSSSASLAAAEAPPVLQPRRIKIVRDAILAFIFAIALTLGLFVVGFVIALLAGWRPESTFKATPVVMVAAVLASEIPFAAVAFFLRWRYRSTGRILPVLFEGPYISAIFIGIGAGIVMAAFGFVHAFVATKLFGSASTEAMEELMGAVLDARGNPAAVSALVFSIALLAPFCEEFLFRGAMFSSVRSSANARAAAVVSSSLFAIAHLNASMFTYYLVFGFVMCWLLSKTQTIAAPIAAHVTVNATATIAMLLGPGPVQ